MQSLLLQVSEASARSGISWADFNFVMRRQYLITMLKENKLNKVRTARELGIHRNTVARLIAELGIRMEHLREVELNKKPAASEKPSAAAANAG